MKLFGVFGDKDSLQASLKNHIRCSEKEKK